MADRGVDPEEYPATRFDAISGSIFANVVSVTIIIATAAAIGGSRALTSAAEAAKALVPVAGVHAEALFGIGLLGASALAAAVVPLSTAYAVAEAVGVERSVSRSFREAPLFMGLFTGLIVIGAGVALLPGNLITLLLDMQVLNGLDHAHRAGVHPHPGQPPQPARPGRERPRLPGGGYRVHGSDLRHEPAAARLHDPGILRHRWLAGRQEPPLRLR